MTHSENITVFAHGIIDDASQSQRFQKVITTQLIAPNFSDALSPSGHDFNNFLYTICSYFGKKVNRNAMFMGQKNDIEAIKATIDSINSKDQITLYGCSRGAATLITYLGMHNPENIAALVLDACPADIAATIKMPLAKMGINPECYNAIFSYLFPQYDPISAIPPIHAIKSIKNKNLPILLIHSIEDTMVHPSNSYFLYNAFINAGFTNVHLYLLPHGKHSFLLQNDRVSDMYMTAVHSFYKKYNLPYNQNIKTFDLKSSNLQELEEKFNQALSHQYLLYETQDIPAIYELSHIKNLCLSATAIALAIAYWYSKNNSL